MRRIFGLVIAGGTLIGLTSGAEAQVTVTTGNGPLPSGTQVTVGQPYVNGGHAPNAFGSPGYSPGYAPNYPSVTNSNTVYRGYRAPGTVVYRRPNARPYYVPAQTTYRRMGRSSFVGKRHGRGKWHRTVRYR